jgi:tetratricopeptide (TPR) repeat protein
MKRSVLLHLAFAVFIAGGLLFLPRQGQAQSVEEYLRQGDDYFQKFDNQKALEAYLSALRADSTNCEALWKVARAYVDIGEVSEKNLQRQYYFQAEKTARRAVQHCPEVPDAHFMLAVSTGRIALYEGGATKFKLSKIVKAEVDTTLMLDPNHFGAWHVKARWARELASQGFLKRTLINTILGGMPEEATMENAVAWLKKAVEIAPEHINNHLELGRTYIMLKRYEEARPHLQKVLDLPVSDADDPAHKEEAKKLLRKIRGK